MNHPHEFEARLTGLRNGYRDTRSAINSRYQPLIDAHLESAANLRETLRAELAEAKARYLADVEAVKAEYAAFLTERRTAGHVGAAEFSRALDTVRRWLSERGHDKLELLRDDKTLITIEITPVGQEPDTQTKKGDDR